MVESQKAHHIIDATLIYNEEMKDFFVSVVHLAFFVESKRGYVIYKTGSGTSLSDRRTIASHYMFYKYSTTNDPGKRYGRCRGNIKV